MDKMRRSYDDTTVGNAEGFADRGMLHSGPSMATGVKLRDDYNRKQGEVGLANTTNLATIARRKLESDSKYKMDTVLANLGFTTQ